MKTVKKEIEVSQVEKLQALKNDYEVFEGVLLDNYIFSDMESVTFKRCKPRKYALIKEVFLNEWSSKYQLIMTDSEKEVEAFRQSFAEKLLEQPETEQAEVSAEKEVRKMKSVLKIEQRYISEERSFYKIHSSIQTANLARSIIGENASESFLVMCLNAKNEVTAYCEVFKGTITNSLASPREIFQFALLNNASRIILAHTHPSGDVTPSEADKLTTAKLADAGRMLNLEVLDHIIVSSNSGYYSFREEGAI